MKIKYFKTNLSLLAAILPISFIGYLLAVYEESLFFLYEWSLLIIVIAIAVISVMSAIQTNGSLKWIPISVGAFIIQFSILGLFLGPFTSAVFFMPFYIVSIMVLATYVTAFKKVEKYKYIPITLFILSILFLTYMLLLNGLWGQDVTFIQSTGKFT